MKSTYAIVTQDPHIAAPYIVQGRVVAFPTGTSYGLAADALQGHALQRVRNLKRRPQEKPLSVYMVPRVWDTYLDLTSEERLFLEQHASSALTLVVKPKEGLSHLAYEGCIALRVIDHPLMERLADIVDVPLTATSANLSEQEPCYTVEDIQRIFPGREDTTYDLSLACILDGGALSVRKPSTIAKVRNGSIEIIRQGSLTL
jgi:L-threonylcarbamoyladenylate synthase